MNSYHHQVQLHGAFISARHGLFADCAFISTRLGRSGTPSHLPLLERVGVCDKVFASKSGICDKVHLLECTHMDSPNKLIEFAQGGFDQKEAKMSRGRKISCIGCYHVVLRGNGKQLLFDDDDDRQAFLEALGQALDSSNTSLIAWCLMSNHVHLCFMLDDPEDIGALSKTMQTLESRYAGRFNWKNGHVGHVFQRRFESMPIEDERYLLEAVRYIHNNPEKAGVRAASEYWWSSYHEYTGRSRLCNTAPVLEMLGGVDGFRAFSQSAEERPYFFNSGRRISDAEMLDAALLFLGDLHPRDIKGLPKPARNEKLTGLRSIGLSVRQIERLTGIGSATIARATAATK